MNIVCVAGLAKELAAGENTCGTIINKIMAPQVFLVMLELLFMRLLCVNIIQVNKLFFFLLLLLFSLLSVYMPHSFAETHGHHDYESSYKYVINNSKPAANLRKLLKRLRAFFIKAFNIQQLLMSIAILVNTHLVLFNMRFSNIFKFNLFSVLCFYFHGGKFKKLLAL